MPCNKCNQIEQLPIRRDYDLEKGRNCIDKDTYKELVKSYRRADGGNRKKLRALHGAIDETVKNWKQHQAINGFNAQAKYDINKNTFCYDKRPGVGLSLYCDEELEATQPWGGFLTPKEGTRASYPECETLTYQDCPPADPCGDHVDPDWVSDNQSQTSC